MAESIPRESILDIPRFLPPGGAAIRCSEIIKAAGEENAVFSALKSSICASPRHYRPHAQWVVLRHTFVRRISLPVCALRHCARFYFS
jgi:hypothetical protein